METREYTTIIRTDWPVGEWDGEPDKVQWEDEATRMPCLAVRSPYGGHWCGYVGVAPGHPLHGQGYEAPDVDIHGGLTFAAVCNSEKTEETGVCHSPGEGEAENVWWFGFDCAHYHDCSPIDLKRANELVSAPTIWEGSSYKTLDYVKQQCRSLAQQLLHNA